MHAAFLTFQYESLRPFTIALVPLAAASEPSLPIAHNDIAQTLESESQEDVTKWSRASID